MTLDVAAGSGGRGAVSFRHEKFVPRGGPDGGDGGRGGRVILDVDLGETTLSQYRQRRRFRAEDGRPGGPARRTGADGADLVLRVPPGTVATDAASAELLGDLTTAGQRLTVAAGGAGGRGNAHFATPTRQAPRLGELGGRGEARQVHLELKLIADIGLVGLPNAGKSTLLAAATGAHPKIAAYPFTTLHPNLGVAELGDGRSLVLADVPGLIEGAHAGAGLGIEFLRHLERTRVLVHVVDCSGGADSVRRAIEQVGEELRAFSPALAARPALVALNKIDLVEARQAAADLERELPGALPISAAAGTGVSALIDAAARLVDQTRAAGSDAIARAAGDEPVGAAADAATAMPAGGAAPAAGGHRVYRYTPPAREPLRITRDPDGALRVGGAGLERLVGRTDLGEDEAVSALQGRLAARGVDAALAAAGCREGDTVRIGDIEFIYSEGATPEAFSGRGGRRRRQRDAPPGPDSS